MSLSPSCAGPAPAAQAPASPPASGPASPPASPPAAPPMQRGVIAAALILLAALAWTAREAGGAPGLWAALIGAGAGLSLHRAAFGFASAWRAMLLQRRSRGLRAQLLLIAAACLLAWPLLGWGGAWGLEARGVVLPMGLASALGAFAFGIGMQLGGGCASGTLYVAGGGSARMMLVLAAFVAGSVLATLHWDFWNALPRTRAGVSVPGLVGTIPAMALGSLLLAALWLWLRRVETAAHGAALPLGPPRLSWRGGWSPAAGALALAAVSILCLLALGRPWGITSGFALWGARAAQALGAEPALWPGGYWSGWREAQLAAPLLADTTSVMNIAILLGALAAAGLAGDFAPWRRIGARQAVSAVLGGLLMGYGARLAYGCNIGAYLGGLVSGSLHGLWWVGFALPGSLLGARLRGPFGL